MVELISCKRRSHRNVGKIAQTDREDSKYAGSHIRSSVECSFQLGVTIIVS